jgi:hypothetical protein
MDQRIRVAGVQRGREEAEQQGEATGAHIT